MSGKKKKKSNFLVDIRNTSLCFYFFFKHLEENTTFLTAETYNTKLIDNLPEMSFNENVGTPELSGSEELISSTSSHS